MNQLRYLCINLICFSLSLHAQDYSGSDAKCADGLLSEYSDLSKKTEKALEKRAADIQSIPDAPSQESGSRLTRRIKTKLWLELLDEIDHYRDLKFNFDDRPTMHVAPPIGVKSSVPLISGMDPAAIPDPQIRSEYEEAIRRNNIRAAQYQLQSRLKLLGEQYTRFVVEYLKSAYARTPEDSKELLALVESGLNNQTHKAEIEKELHDL